MILHAPFDVILIFLCLGICNAFGLYAAYQKGRDRGWQQFQKAMDDNIHRYGMIRESSGKIQVVPFSRN